MRIPSSLEKTIRNIPNKKLVTEKIKTSVAEVSQKLSIPEAKAIAARYGVLKTQPSYRQFYKKFAALEKDTLNYRESSYLEFLKKDGNPINENNIELIRNKLLKIKKLPLCEITSENEEFLRECNNPEDMHIFIVMWHEVLLNRVQKEWKNILKELEDRKISYSEAKKAYEILKIKDSNAQNALIKAITQGSTIPEALVIEDKIRSLGIKNVNISNDVEQGKRLIKAVKNAKDKGVPLPDTLIISDSPIIGAGKTLNLKHLSKILLPSTKTENFMTSWFDKIDQIFSSSVFTKHSKKEKEEYIKQLMQINKKEPSTKNHNHQFNHELGHTVNKDNLSLIIQEDPLKGFIPAFDSERAFCEGISCNAGRSIDEALQELFAKLMDGQRLTKKEMAFYKKYNGFIPPNLEQYSLKLRLKRKVCKDNFTY